MRGARVAQAFLLLAFLSSASSAQPVEHGQFRLHKFQLPVGQESYEISRNGATLTLSADFQFTDRLNKVPLKAVLATDLALRPQHFEIRGRTSRLSNIDL